MVCATPFVIHLITESTEQAKPLLALESRFHVGWNVPEVGWELSQTPKAGKHTRVSVKTER